MRNPLNIVLFVFVVFTAARFYFVQSEVTTLRAEYARVSAKYKDIDVLNPKSYYAAAVETGDPMAFAWRYHQPSGVDLISRAEYGALGSSTVPLPADPRRKLKLHRIAFESTDDGIRYYDNHRPRSYNDIRWNRELGKFLSNHWGELRFSALGEGGSAIELPPDAVLTFLTIEVPPELEEELKASVGEDRAAKLMRGPIFRLILGSDEAIQAMVSDESQ